jgi:DNA-binding response OmpR family regulator
MILVVDSDRTAVELLRELLESEGYEVRTAYSGEEAYRHVRDSKCKGVLLDLQMPGINGAELLMLMAAESIPVPVIVMTGNPDFDEKELKNFANVRKLLRKPLYPEDVLAAVRQHAHRPFAR